MTAFKKRYSAAFSYAKEWLERFPSEDWLSLSVDYCSGAYPNDVRELTFLFDFAIHHLDLVHYLAGDILKVFAFARGQEAYAVSLQFESGAVGTMNLDQGRSFEVPTEEVELTVRGGNSLTLSNSSSWRETIAGTPTAWREPSTFTSGGDSGLDTGHLGELLAFAAHLKDGSPVRSPIEEALKSLVLHDAIITSVESGQAVERLPVAHDRFSQSRGCCPRYCLPRHCEAERLQIPSRLRCAARSAVRPGPRLGPRGR